MENGKWKFPIDIRLFMRVLGGDDYDQLPISGRPKSGTGNGYIDKSPGGPARKVD